jgi:hypothetical protein
LLLDFRQDLDGRQGIASAVEKVRIRRHMLEF